MNRKALKEKLLILALYALVVGVFWVMDWPCVFLSVLGIPCPGCGMTRAWLSVLQLDLAAAFAYHPMFWSVPLIFVYLLLPGGLMRQKWLNNAIFAVIGVGFVVAWVTKLL